MIFYACINYNGSNPESYKGIEVKTMGTPSVVVATFHSYDPKYDYQNFISWIESVGDDNVAFCDSIKQFAKDYKQVSEQDSDEMLSMVYGNQQDCDGLAD